MNKIDRNSSVPHDTEDRNWWYMHGEHLEEQFVALCRSRLNINAEINPEKFTNNTAPDLIVDGKIADLKTQNTPFFTAGRYKMDPRYTVTFNRKDYERYRIKYPEIVIYFWLDWMQTQWKNSRVEYLGGIYKVPFFRVKEIIEQGAPEHTYIHRQTPGDRNAKSSFLLDVREFEYIFTTENKV